VISSLVVYLAALASPKNSTSVRIGLYPHNYYPHYQNRRYFHPESIQHQPRYPSRKPSAHKSDNNSRLDKILWTMAETGLAPLRKSDLSSQNLFFPSGSSAGAGVAEARRPGGSSGRIPNDGDGNNKKPNNGMLPWFFNLAGPAGAPGNDGRDGPQGPMGPLGAQGMQGITGVHGLTGMQGVQGSPGPQGSQGPPGIPGIPGIGLMQKSLKFVQLNLVMFHCFKKGRDGVNGKDGRDGVEGNDGKNGKDGQTGLTGKMEKPVC
jgi:hypothetical protein